MTGRPVVEEYDLIIFDLDGVLYLGEHAVPGAPEAVRRLVDQRVPAVYATNNASRSGEAVARLLGSLGVPAVEDEIVTSGWATARLLADRYPPGSPVLVVGSPALDDEIDRVGLRPVRHADEKPVAVAQGYGPKVGWADLAEATLAIRSGAEWIATNTDRTLPTPRGPLPGNGALVAAIAAAVGREPDTVVGKPGPTLFHQVTRDREAHAPLVVGDRLDTDIEGANRADMDSLLVLTGVSTPAEVFAAPPPRRPTLLAEDLGGLFAPRGTLRFDRSEDRGWRVLTEGPVWYLSGEGEAIDALRVLCARRWGMDSCPVPGEPAPAAGQRVAVRSTPVPEAPVRSVSSPEAPTAIVGEGPAARDALLRLGLA